MVENSRLHPDGFKKRAFVSGGGARTETERERLLLAYQHQPTRRCSCRFPLTRDLGSRLARSRSPVNSIFFVQLHSVLISVR
ncbi:Protein of unknown function [Gryllus bimaculatus]|nr:Protein of unknown function [Gryllus bimaculatus]